MAGPQDKWIICIVCDGEGKVVNPAIDSNGLTAEDFEDRDFAEAYRTGQYDVTCTACQGTGKIRKSDIKRLEEGADNRRLAAREDGNFEAYQGSGDYRWGY